MDEHLIEVVSGFGVGWVLITAIAYFWMQTRLKASVKFEYDKKVKLIDHGYNEQLAQFRTKLEHESEISVVKLTKELELKASERNIKLTTTFDRQAKIIADAYERLVKYKDAAERCTDDKDETRKQFYQIAVEFLAFYRTNKLYFPSASSKLLEECYRTIHNTTSKINTAQMAQMTGAHHISAKAMEDYFALVNSIPAMLTALEIDFQKVLGIHEDEKKHE